MAGSVVCIGEALVDMLPVGHADTPTYRAAWGGSALNVAVGASRLGSTVEFAGSFADDPLGRQLMDFLRDEGVGLDLSTTVDAQTTLALLTFQGSEPHYSFYGQPTSYGFVPPAIGVRQQVVNASVVHTGSLGVLEALTFDAMLEALRATSAVTTCDLNVRANMVVDWDDYRSRLGAIIALSDVVKFSAEDCEQVYPGQTVERVAMAALQGRTQAVVVTRAAEPASVYTAAGQVDLPIAPGWDIIDSTGGGDGLMAAVIHQIAQSGLPIDINQWESYLSHALLVAGLVCSRAGGAIAMPTREEVIAAGVSW